MRGGCGCDKPMNGGSANLDVLPARYYYELNNENNNPIYMKGGKKKKMKGGMPDFLIGGPMNSFGMANGITQFRSRSKGFK